MLHYCPCSRRFGTQESILRCLFCFFEANSLPKIPSCLESYGWSRLVGIARFLLPTDSPLYLCRRVYNRSGYYPCDQSSIYWDCTCLLVSYALLVIFILYIPRLTIFWWPFWHLLPYYFVFPLLWMYFIFSFRLRLFRLMKIKCLTKKIKNNTNNKYSTLLIHKV